MNNILRNFEPLILEAIQEFESGSPDLPVTWGSSLDFYPDLERATEDNVPLVATIGIYLQIPGPSDDTVVSGSIFVPPHSESSLIKRSVAASLVTLADQRSSAPL